MMPTRTSFYLAGSAYLVLSLGLLLSLEGYFRAVERGSGSVGSEKKLLTQLKNFHERLQKAETPDEAKAALAMIEGGAGEVKKAYAPVLAVFASKPREAESRFQLGKKRELMENLVNAYRKEISNGDIRVRAAYLNILFDTQSSLLNESEESEQVFLRRSRDRFDGLKSIVAGAADAGLPVRVAGLDAIFQSLDRAVQHSVKWHGEKRAALAAEEKALPEVAAAVFAGEASGIEETRSKFIYIAAASLLIVLLSGVSLVAGFKVLRARAEVKVDIFLSYLRAFGSKWGDLELDHSLRALREDPAWAPVLAEAQRAEEAFLRSSHDLLAVPHSLTSPYIVIGKDKAVRHWNDAAGAVFGLSREKEWGIDDLLQKGLLRARGGDTRALFEVARAAFKGMNEERFDCLVQREGEWQPYELALCPVHSGPIAGGRVLFLREVRSEAERVDRAVAAQLQRARELVQKVTHQYAVELVPADSDGPAIREMISDLDAMKGKNDEREHLWKSEAQALIDQESRQQEVLGRLSEELGEIRLRHGEAMKLVRGILGDEVNWREDVCMMERDLERWTDNRNRLLGDIQQQALVLEKARKFEEQLRSATTSVSADLESYQEEIAQLRQFTDSARVHSVNLSMVRDPGYWEYAARARSFAHDLSRFTEKAEALGEKIRAFLSAHPGGALAAHLNGPVLDGGMVSSIREEQERFSALLSRMRESGEALLTGGEKALELLDEADRKGAVVTQLGEASLLINQQAKGNLERWS
jgi:PAS domain-containing protein